MELLFIFVHNSYGADVFFIILKFVENQLLSWVENQLSLSTGRLSLKLILLITVDSAFALNYNLKFSILILLSYYYLIPLRLFKIFSLSFFCFVLISTDQNSNRNDGYNRQNFGGGGGNRPNRFHDRSKYEKIFSVFRFVIFLKFPCIVSKKGSNIMIHFKVNMFTL